MQKGFFSKPLFFSMKWSAAFFYEGLSRTRKDRHIEDFMASGPIRNVLFSGLGHLVIFLVDLPQLHITCVSGVCFLEAILRVIAESMLILQLQNGR